MKKMKYILLLFIYFGITSNSSGQGKWVNITERENYYDSAKVRIKYYVDANPDTLFYKGEMYFFRQTPLSLKEKYSGIFSNSKKIVTFKVAPAFQVIGDKGYQLTWIIRNDSLFIKNIYPDYNYSWVVKDGKLQYNEDGSEKMESLWGYISADTVRLLVEQFTGNKFKNNLLHVDWITGDFGVIDSYLGPGPGVRYRTGHYRDGREGGFIMTFQNGKLKEMKKDMREIKN